MSYPVSFGATPFRFPKDELTLQVIRQAIRNEDAAALADALCDERDRKNPMYSGIGARNGLFQNADAALVALVQAGRVDPADLKRLAVLAGDESHPANFKRLANKGGCQSFVAASEKLAQDGAQTDR